MLSFLSAPLTAGSFTAASTAAHISGNVHEGSSDGKLRQRRAAQHQAPSFHGCSLDGASAKGCQAPSNTLIKIDSPVHIAAIGKRPYPKNSSRGCGDTQGSFSSDIDIVKKRCHDEAKATSTSRRLGPPDDAECRKRSG
ncbi:hypothetical protein MTO96_001850 [Rhipicephalus appendiculatus]